MIIAVIENNDTFGNKASSWNVFFYFINQEYRALIKTTLVEHHPQHTLIKAYIKNIDKTHQIIHK